MTYVRTAGLILFLVTALLGSPSPPWAQETTERQQLETDAALDEAIADLEAAVPSSTPQAGGPSLLQQLPRRAPRLRLIDVSLDVLLFAGFSSEHDDSISTLQGGGHDPKTRGYTLGQTELSLAGVVDPYFTAAAHILSVISPNSGETTFELEEAFLATTGLPLGLQLEVGYFLTEFGIINPQHPHIWDWLDMPIANTRMFGGDGMRQAGFRASWLLNTPWFSQLHVGMQHATGVTMASFLVRAKSPMRTAVMGKMHTATWMNTATRWRRTTTGMTMGKMNTGRNTTSTQPKAARVSAAARSSRRTSASCRTSST